MCYNFKNKVVVVFGAENKLGNNLCNNLIEAEADVVGIDFVSGQSVDYILNNYNQEEIKNILDKIVNNMGYIYGVVNNLFYSEDDVSDKIKNTSNIINESLSCLCRNSSIVVVERDFPITSEELGINDVKINMSSGVVVSDIVKKYSNKLAPTTRINCITTTNFCEPEQLVMKRKINLSEISNPVMFFLSEESSYITGQSINIG